MNAKEKERQEAVRELRELLKPGDVVYTQLVSVSRSGMSRVIMPLVIRNNEPRRLDYLVAKATGYTLTPTGRNEGVKIGGCGMDMGFELVYQLSSVLFPDGFPVVEVSRCKHCQDRPGFDGIGKTCKYCAGTGIISTPKRGRNGDMSGWDKDGGYALRQRWL